MLRTRAISEPDRLLTVVLPDRHVPAVHGGPLAHVPFCIGLPPRRA